MLAVVRPPLMPTPSRLLGMADQVASGNVVAMANLGAGEQGMFVALQ